MMIALHSHCGKCFLFLNKNRNFILFRYKLPLTVYCRILPTQTITFEITFSRGSRCIRTLECRACTSCSSWSFVNKLSIFFIEANTFSFIATTPTSTPTNCRYSQFPCLNGQCIGRRYVCDGVNNCYDGSDEDYCNSTGWFFYPVGVFLPV